MFFTATGAAVALVVFAGFSRTYYLSRWLTPPERTPEMTTLLHVHALAFSLWILLGAVQPALVAGGRVALHRSLGTAGAALALLVWGLGNLASIAAMNVGSKGVGDPHASMRSPSSPCRRSASSWRLGSGSAAERRRTSG